MNGIINVLKPSGMTSFDVVACIRGILSEKKVGHAGTLDPLAVGVLPIFIGKATKAVSFVINENKKYRAELKLGIKTETQDADGEILEIKEAEVYPKKIYNVFKSFKGEYSQIPPMYSAKKINGKRLYELARKGVDIEREKSKVNIFSINIIDMDLTAKFPTVLFDVECSKGTYIRTLCADIGERLGCGGHMSFLIRTRVGIFDIKEALTLEEIKDALKRGLKETIITPIDKLFKEYDSIILNEKNRFRILNGASIRLENDVFKPGDLYRLYGRNKEFLAIGEVFKDRRSNWLKARKVFI